MSRHTAATPSRAIASAMAGAARAFSGAGRAAQLALSIGHQPLELHLWLLVLCVVFLHRCTGSWEAVMGVRGGASSAWMILVVRGAAFCPFAQLRASPLFVTHARAFQRRFSGAAALLLSWLLALCPLFLLASSATSLRPPGGGPFFLLRFTALLLLVAFCPLLLIFWKLLESWRLEG